MLPGYNCFEDGHLYDVLHGKAAVVLSGVHNIMRLCLECGFNLSIMYHSKAAVVLNESLLVCIQMPVPCLLSLSVYLPVHLT